MLEESVCDLRIAQYTEFNHFFFINVDVTLCLFSIDVFGIAVGFRFCLNIKVSTSD